MAKQFIVLLTLAVLSSVAAFTPNFNQQSQRVSSHLSARSRSKQNKSQKPNPAAGVNVVDDFDGIDMIPLLGLKRLKKKARRNKRVLNQKIREGKVIQDEEGVWVPRSN
mmetsp:Transcript_19643/g.41207  ORF Transcript_19643/g.41207 Transcript_19643/m.41207 type:complete len:109 (-) Transcript_19643:321-647(-)|eukprot:CAMPEP_0171339730 /NCGR_PEP_ID=MMETSP0878-20121228/8120_1 /TAXON_ID=67004 /ORGANISM="Thalassiosira weissflogii, Strain CCMP1336" /LENGTH=108 /DNA_ID=CAMNT_0011841677 /DNA_START=119 /DNA_END=445 /DNA_ORIENTATION=+